MSDIRYVRINDGVIIEVDFNLKVSSTPIDNVRYIRKLDDYYGSVHKLWVPVKFYSYNNNQYRFEIKNTQINEGFFAWIWNKSSDAPFRADILIQNSYSIALIHFDSGYPIKILDHRFVSFIV